MQRAVFDATALLINTIKLNTIHLIVKLYLGDVYIAGKEALVRSLRKCVSIYVHKSWIAEREVTNLYLQLMNLSHILLYPKSTKLLAQQPKLFEGLITFFG
jgi:hypothetical protein